MSRKIRVSLLLAGAVILLLLADAAGWWFLTRRMEAELATWQQTQIAQGAFVQFGPVSHGGWPFEAELTLPAVTLATDVPGQPDAVAWQSNQVRLVFAPWHPETLALLIDGPQTVRFGTAAPVDITATRLNVSIPLDASGQAQGVAVRARGLSVPLAGGPLQLASLRVRLRASDVFVTATGATLPGRSLPFGGTIQTLDFHAGSSGPIPPLRDPATALAAWRDRGQRLDVDNLTLQWGPLDVRGHASLGLDAGMQPQGSASVQLTGFTEVTEALARSGAITRNDARVATTLLGLMSRPGTNDVAEADLPLTLRDRTLSVGAIPLLRLPVLKVP